MFFLTSYELAFSAVLGIELLNDLTMGTMFYSKDFMMTILRSLSIMIIYCFCVYFGKLRLSYFFMCMSYMLTLLHSLLQLDALLIPILVMKVFTAVCICLMSYSYSYDVDGPYGCGYREFRLTKAPYTNVSVYYPMDKNQWELGRYDTGNSFIS